MAMWCLNCCSVLVLFGVEGGCLLRNCRVDALFVEAIGGSHPEATEGAACCPNVSNSLL